MGRAWAPFAIPALAIPPLIAFNAPPSSTFFNQAAALIGWAIWCAAIASALPGAPARLDRGVAALIAALGAVALAALLGPGATGLPGSLALSAAGMLLAAMLVAGLGACAAGAGRADDAFAALCTGLVVAGIGSSLVGLVQVFAPALADGHWIAAGSIPGLAIGNLRQPNHLMTLLLWALVATAWLTDTGRLPRPGAAVIGAVMLVVVVLSASRTAIAGALLLAAWGALDRRLHPTTRWALIATPLLYALAWGALSVWSQASGAAFVGESKFSAARAIASSRWAIYADTLTLIRAAPWTGVGFGEFNLAWSLSVLPTRPTAFFDHTHSLPLQLAVELGIPAALLVCALLGYALWRAIWLARRATHGPGRAATVIVLMAVLHSLLEYPLWYAYFLLPAAFAFGIALGIELGRPASSGDVRGGSAGPWRPALVASLLMLVLSVASLVDYSRVVTIFAPSDGDAPLEQRIARGERSILFAHHAHYAAATTAQQPSKVMHSFAVASHYLLDTRLMTAWADAYAEAGDLERARYIAMRLREFRNAGSEEYFALCHATSQQPRPYQCAAPERTLAWQDFRVPQ